MLCSERLAGELGSAPDEPGTSEEEHQLKLDKLLESHAAALALGLVTGGETPEERAARSEVKGVLCRALATLPERERALVERHYFNGEDFDEIAADLGISKSWASRLHAQAIQALGPKIIGLKE